MLFIVNQGFPSLRWRVVPVPEEQGLAMRNRECPHVYDTSAQAYTIAQRLNTRRRAMYSHCSKCHKVLEDCGCDILQATYQCDGTDAGLGCDCGQAHSDPAFREGQARIAVDIERWCPRSEDKEDSYESRTVGGGSPGTHAPAPAAAQSAVPVGDQDGNRAQRAPAPGQADENLQKDRSALKAFCQFLKNRMAEVHQDHYGDFDLEDIYMVVNQTLRDWEES